MVLATVVIVGFAAFALRSTGGHPTAKSAKTAAPADPGVTATRAAALDLARQPAARFTGNLTTTAGVQIPVALTVTNAGTTIGRVMSASSRIEILVMSGRTFFKADPKFWTGAGASATRATRYASRWVRIEAGYIGIDPEQRLAPRVLSAQLLEAAKSSKSIGAPVSRNGVQARPVTIPQATVYVSTEAPYRVVHIETETTQAPGDGITPAAYADDSGFDLDVDPLTEPDAASLFAGLKVNVSRLLTAIDSQVDFDLDGSVVLAPCTARGCTATATLGNTLRGSDTYVRTDRPIIVEVLVAFTLDARPIRSCTDVVTMTANGKTKTSCRVTYSLPADGTSHTIRAKVSGFARAVSASDVSAMTADLDRQTLAWRVRQAGDSGLPDASIGNGTYQFRPPATYSPAAGPLSQVDG
ncbi:MAG: hypothetical protein WCB04_01710, partial [Mycobacteriales bacterium]